MTVKSASQKIDGVSLAFGSLFILTGLVFAIARFVGFDFLSAAWPFYVIAPSALLFVYGLTMRNGVGETLSIMGMMGATTGALLFFQNLSDHWESWAYAWALVTPTAVGIAQIFYGVFHGRTKLIRTGIRLAGIGLGLFMLGAFFFEFIIGFSGVQLGSLGVALLLILLGLGIILRPIVLGNNPDDAIHETTLPNKGDVPA